MEFYQLQSFMAVAKTGNLTRAATMMHISQSALSAQIKALEDEFGALLFIRSPKGMQLSAAGKALLPEATDIIRAAEKMKLKAMEFSAGWAGELNIGINTDPKFLEVSDITRKMAERWARVNLSFIESQTFETASMLKQEKIDVGFHYGAIRDPQIFSMTLTPVVISVVIPGVMAKETKDAPLEALAGLPWIWTRHGCPFHREFEKHLEKKGLKLNTVADAVEENIVRELVKSETGLALMRKDEALELVRQGSAVIWSGFDMELGLGVACLEKRKSEKIISGFLEVIQAKYQIC